MRLGRSLRKRGLFLVILIYMIFLPKLNFRSIGKLPKKYILKRSVGFGVLFVSTFLLCTEVVYPHIATLADAQALSPVPENYFDQLALKRLETFSFDELNQRRKTEGSGLPEELQLAPGENVPEVFYLSVPKLNLHDVPVETNSVDTTPNEKLGHYKGSSLPGKPGNVFIYGHSTLPSYFNEKNFKTLFTFLPKMDKGDEIFIKYGDKQFKYLVERKEVSNPDNLDPLKWRHLHYGSISLMTCVPPGTVDQRMVVFAKQVFSSE